MRLGAWATVWFDYAFDRERGTYSRLWRLWPHSTHPISGVGAVERTKEFSKVFFSIHLWQRKPYFQAGLRRWCLDSRNLRFELRASGSPAEHLFRVFEGSAQVFQCTYRPRRRTALAKLDVSYDNLDFELDHLLAHVSAMSLPAVGFDAWVDGDAA